MEIIEYPRKLTANEAAKVLGLSCNTFRRNVNNGYYGPNLRVIKTSPRKTEFLENQILEIYNGTWVKETG